MDSNVFCKEDVANKKLNKECVSKTVLMDTDWHESLQERNFFIQHSLETGVIATSLTCQIIVHFQ